MVGIITMLIGVAGALVVWFGLRRDSSLLKAIGIVALVAAVGAQVLADRPSAIGRSPAGVVRTLAATPHAD